MNELKLNEKSIKKIDSDPNKLEAIYKQALSELVTKWINVLNLKFAKETAESKQTRIQIAEQALKRALETPEASRTRIAIESLQLLNSTEIDGETTESLKRAI